MAGVCQLRCTPEMKARRTQAWRKASRPLAVCVKKGTNAAQWHMPSHHWATPHGASLQGAAREKRFAGPETQETVVRHREIFHGAGMRSLTCMH